MNYLFYLIIISNVLTACTIGITRDNEDNAILWKNKKEVIISNIDQDKEVLINYRAIDHQQTIKKGDIIKVGTALLQYYEI